MKRRNAETGKMRRPVKRTKITEGMYGSSMLYLKFVMVWASVVLADYMLEFRFEFLWPFWMLLRSVYDSFKYQGLAFSVFFICIALTSDMICFFFIPLQYIFFAASTYVWVQYVWYTFADKGVCLPTVAICCLVVYVEGALRSAAGDRGGGGLELCRPLAAHCVGYPAVNLGFGVKAYVGHRLRLRKQRQVRAQNEFYFQLMRDALPESALEQQPKEPERSISANGECVQVSSSANSSDTRHMNGSLRRRVRPEQNGHCAHDVAATHAKLEKLEKHLANQQRDKTHAHSNGTAGGAGAPHTADDDDRHDHAKGSAKSSKCEKKEANNLKEEKRKNKNKDKDKDSDSHKSTEQTKEQIVKEVESTKDNHIRNHKDVSSNKEREREKEKERETREREKEREREREREQREARECAEELKRVKCELAAARSAEAEARRALAASAAAERQRRTEYQQLKQAHANLQHKVSLWRTGERATLERRLSDERRARALAEHQLRTARLAAARPTSCVSGECDSSWCRDQRAAGEAEMAAARREARRAQERADRLQRDLALAADQVRSLEAAREATDSPTREEREAREAREANEAREARAMRTRLAGACAELQERAAHLERSLSAETRVKLDLLSALGEAKRQMQIQEGIISRQEKEIEELKAQMLAVMPTEYPTPVSGNVSKFRIDSSPLDPNASVYTPKQQLCSDA